MNLLFKMQDNAEYAGVVSEIIFYISYAFLVILVSKYSGTVPFEKNK